MQRIFIVLLALNILVCKSKPDIDSAKISLDTWAYDVLQLPSLQVSNKKTVVVAVVDDGFRLSHKALKKYIFTNRGEIPANGIDDDQNGYIDDYQGWDVSDGDSDVSITKELETGYYHGTFISSTITRTAFRCFGEDASQMVKILPVKVLGDQSTSTAIRDGYKGIEYATKMGADIICCAWSGGNASTSEIDVVNKALQNNIMLIASAGNMFNKNVDNPANLTGVYAIAALDTMLQKRANSNYGMKVDLALPGEKVKAAYPVADNAFFYGEGTSAAAGLATGCATVLKVLKPSALPAEIMEALKNTTTPLDSLNIKYCGKLGAGLPNMNHATEYLLNPRKRWMFFNSSRPEGVIYFSGKQGNLNFEIKPYGAYHNVQVIPGQVEKKDAGKVLKVYNNSGFKVEEQLQNMQSGFVVPGSEATISVTSHKKRDVPNIKLHYFVETIDSTTLFCGGIQSLSADTGIIEDGSKDQLYANNSSCKWQVTAPGSSRITFRFSEFNTEAKVDYVWLFDGTVTHTDFAIARFSGDKIPPEVTSRTNNVLVWFVTDNQNTAQGWKMHFEGVK